MMVFKKRDDFRKMLKVSCLEAKTFLLNDSGHRASPKNLVLYSGKNRCSTNKRCTHTQWDWRALERCKVYPFPNENEMLFENK